MFANGFTAELLVELVRAGLASAHAERMVANGKMMETAFRSLVQEGAGALLVTAAPYFDTRRDRIIAFAARQRLPAI